MGVSVEILFLASLEAEIPLWDSFTRICSGCFDDTSVLFLLDSFVMVTEYAWLIMRIVQLKICYRNNVFVFGY